LAVKMFSTIGALGVITLAVLLQQSRAAPPGPPGPGGQTRRPNGFNRPNPRAAPDCKEYDLESWLYAYTQRSMADRGSVLSIDLVKDYTPEKLCEKLNDTFGHSDKIVWTAEGCRGKFKICLDPSESEDKQMQRIMDQLDLVKKGVDRLTKNATDLFERIEEISEELTESEVDECNNECHAMATCEDGHCICNEGYGGDGTTVCLDVNECEGQSHGCHAQASCINSRGSYSCTCQSGYTGDGKSCADVDECQAAQFPCTQEQVCTNTPGGFLCENCQAPFKKGATGECTECADGYTPNGDSCSALDPLL